MATKSKEKKIEVGISLFQELEVLELRKGVSHMVDGELWVGDPFTSDEEYEEWRASQTAPLPQWIKMAKTRAHFLKNVMLINSLLNGLEEDGIYDAVISGVMAGKAAS